MEISRFGKHLAGWLIFISFENLALLSVGTSVTNSAEYLLHFLLIFIIFYFNTILAFNTKLYLKSKILFLSILTLTELIIYSAFIILSYTIIPDFVSIPVPHLFFDKIIEGNLWRVLYFIALSVFYWLSVGFIKQRTRIQELKQKEAAFDLEKQEFEKKLQSTQNAFLQSQINPHLLFNTLNFIYNSVEKASHEASEMVMIVNDLMRYALQEPDCEGKIQLKDELASIDNFARLNQLRFANKTTYKMIIKGDFKNVRVYPQVLLPLIENIFKHGDLENEQHPATVNVTYQNGVLYFRSLNKKRKGNGLKGTSIGLANVKNRLNNYYPNSHELQIQELPESFQINLMIRLE